MILSDLRTGYVRKDIAIGYSMVHSINTVTGNSRISSIVTSPLSCSNGVADNTIIEK